jgi:hypothetical protein
LRSQRSTDASERFTLRRNLDQLIASASLLKPILSDLVFVGGAVTPLLVTDDAAGVPRVTRDLDAIAEITSYAAYTAFGEKLRALGFSEDSSPGAPLCRWVQREVILDLMPIDEDILGFSNRWYRGAINSAEIHELTPNLQVKVVSAPYFLATKLEAFHGRGRNDFTFSHDLEDFIYVVNGRETIGDEIESELFELRDFIRFELSRLLNTRSFVDALPGYLTPDLAGQARLPLVLRRLEALAS